MNKLIVLDYNSGVCTSYQLGTGDAGWQSEDYEDFLESREHNINDVYYMVTTEDINIIK